MNEKTKRIVQKVSAGAMLATGVALFIFSLGMVMIPILGVIGIVMLITAVSAVVAASRFFNATRVRSFPVATASAVIFSATVILFPLIQAVSGEGIVQWSLLIINAVVAFIAPLVLMREVNNNKG